MATGPPGIVPLVAAHVPLALLLDPPPTPTPAPAGATAHGLAPAVERSTASATMVCVAASPAASVGAVATGSVVAARPPSGADASDVASAGSVAGPLLPVTTTLGGAPAPGEVPGWVIRVVDPICVGSVTAGTTAGAASTTGVSPDPVVAASAMPLGSAAVAQLPLALALEAVSRPAAAPVGAIAHGSVAAETSLPMLDVEASAPAEALVGLVTSGVVAPAASTCGSPVTIGATSTSSPVAAGAETSGAELVDTSAAARGSVSGSDVSGTLTAASTVLGAVTAGSAWVASETPASGCGLAGSGGVVSALAPDGLAEA